MLVDPADRAVLGVDQQGVLEWIGVQPAPDLGGVVAGPGDDRCLQLELGDPPQRQALEAAVRPDEAGHELVGGGGQDLPRLLPLRVEAEFGRLERDGFELFQIAQLAAAAGHALHLFSLRPETGIDGADGLVVAIHGRLQSAADG